jgi:pyruvate-ferredoxin/flavodoxin oxidoreductase
LSHLFEVHYPAQVTADFDMRPAVAANAPEFVKNVTAMMIAGRGNELPVSAFPADGTYPSGTAKWEKRALSNEVPLWDESLCIQCGKCVLICPHSAIRAKVADTSALSAAPDGFKTAPARWRQFSDQQYTLQVAPDDCTGCTLCVEICPVHSKSEPAHRALNMASLAPVRTEARQNWDYFLGIPGTHAVDLDPHSAKDIQLMAPLFEFSGACSGCGETPYLKLLTQLFGDRMLVANATGCSSIFGGNLPTTPWCTNDAGRGPAWSNSLFEDNAEFGLGIRLAYEQQRDSARRLLLELAPLVGEPLAQSILGANQSGAAGVEAQRQRVEELKLKLKLKLQTAATPEARRLALLADTLVEKTVWVVGGDGWAYDIGYGGLDHVLASGANVNILVLDTEVYSNTGGQRSKATPLGAIARFAAEGKTTPKKDLGLMAMSYENVYIARIALGANDTQTIRAIREAEAYPGPSLVIAYAHCIAHGFEMRHGLEQQKSAVSTGYWPLYRYNPALAVEGKNPLQLDVDPKFTSLADHLYHEDRFEALHREHPDTAAALLAKEQEEIQSRWHLYKYLAAMPVR